MSEDRTEFSPNYVTPGSPRPFQEGNIAQGPGTLGKDFSHNVNYESNDPLQEAAGREQFERNASQGSEYDKGRVIESIMTRHPDPETVRYALRTLQLKEETFNTNGEPSNQWEIVHRYRVLADRAMILRMPIEDLLARDLIEKPSDGELAHIRSQRGNQVNASLNENYLYRPRHVDGLGFETVLISQPIQDSFEVNDQGEMINVRYRLQPQQYVNLRTEDERKEIAGDYEQLKDEVSARSLMMQSWGHHVTYYYALQRLAEGHYFGNNLSSEGIGVILNLKGQEGAKTETATGVEMKGLGQKVETAMRIYYLNALSEKPMRFRKELMDSPGWKQFLFPDGTSPEVIKKWIGTPGEWEPEVMARGNRTEDTLAMEIKAGQRGLFTRRNTFAEVDTFADNQLFNAINEFLGGGENAKYVDKIEAETANRIGYKLFRLFLLADQEGYEVYRDKPLGNNQDPFDGYKIAFSNAPQASDFGKLTHPELYAAKSFRKGRDYMPPTSYLHSRKYYKRFMVDFLRHASANTEIKVLEKGREITKIEERSLMERWWGYKGGFNKNGVGYLDEPAIRLGDLPWSKFNEPITMSEADASLLGIPTGALHHETFKTLWLSGFMAGGDGRAHMIISETNHNPKNFTDLHWWNKFWKMLDVGIKQSVALEGKFRGVTSAEKKAVVTAHKVGIIQNFIFGLQDLPQWEEWKKQSVDQVPNRLGKSPSPQLVDKIIEVANRALKINGVAYELKQLDEVLKPDPDPWK